jgi:hypothetical protein
MHAPSTGTTLRLMAAAVPVGVLLSGVLVWQSSHAAFTAQTANPSNSWSSGTVALADNDSDTALFSATGLKPGTYPARCIHVTYGGTLAADVKMYAASAQVTGDLRPHLTLTIDVETISGTPVFGTCSTAVTSTRIYSGTLADLPTTHGGWSNGAGTWAATQGQTRQYRLAYTVADDNQAQGKTADAVFTWEAQNT